MDEGLDCLPARSLDSFSSPCLRRTSAVWKTTSGDLLDWTSTISLMYLNSSYSSLVIRSACRSSGRAGKKGEKGQGGQSLNSTDITLHIGNTHYITHGQGGNRSVSLLGPLALKWMKMRGSSRSDYHSDHVPTLSPGLSHIHTTSSQLYLHLPSTRDWDIRTYPTDTNIPTHLLSPIHTGNAIKSMYVRISEFGVHRQVNLSFVSCPCFNSNFRSEKKKCLVTLGDWSRRHPRAINELSARDFRRTKWCGIKYVDCRIVSVIVSAFDRSTLRCGQWTAPLR